MEDKTRVIKIESILGGHSHLSHFSSSDQFRGSLGIDPAQPISDTNTKFSTIASGLLRPVPSEKISATTVINPPKWIVTSPKSDNLIYVYDSVGSAYSISPSTYTITGLSDGGSLDASTGNGCSYYDNYIYFSKNTTIARYGPLDGTPGFDGDYWVTTLSKAALTHTTYPADDFITMRYPNHILRRHSDGRLYIADVVGNQGTIHYIQTSKTTVEGDTDAGSTYGKLQVGYGLWPTAIESYGQDLAIALYESPVSNSSAKTNAKIAFWDTTSQNINKITWVEFPDQIITAMKNINGILYVASGNAHSPGCRITQFVGGYTFSEVIRTEDGEPPFAGSLDGNGERLLFGSFSVVPETGATVYSLGLAKNSLGRGLFNVMNCSNSSAAVSAVCLATNTSLNYDVPVVGWGQGASGGTLNGLDIQGTNYSNSSIWWSQLYRIGQPFKIKKIRIPLAQAMAANMIITAKIYTDDGAGTTYTLSEINNTNDPGSFNVIRRSGSAGEVITGQHNFWIELRWSGSALCVVGLPITIEYELIDD